MTKAHIIGYACYRRKSFVIKLLTNLNLFTKNVTALMHQDNKNFTTLIHQEQRQYKKLPLLIRSSKQYTKGAKTSVLKRCAILEFFILYINYLLPVSSNMSICNCKTNRNLQKYQIYSMFYVVINHFVSLSRKFPDRFAGRRFQMHNVCFERFHISTQRFARLNNNFLRSCMLIFIIKISTHCKQ